MGHGNIGLIASQFDLVDDLRDHIVIVVFEGQGILNWKATTDIQAVQAWTDLLQFDIDL